VRDAAARRDLGECRGVERALLAALGRGARARVLHLVDEHAEAEAVAHEHDLVPARRALAARAPDERDGRGPLGVREPDLARKGVQVHDEAVDDEREARRARRGQLRVQRAHVVRDGVRGALAEVALERQVGRDGGGRLLADAGADERRILEAR
jgi:hypothetical protein